MKHGATLLLFLVSAIGIAAAGGKPINPPKFVTIEVPGAEATIVRGINKNGTMVGSYANPLSHGFAISGRNVVTLDVPGASDTACNAINSANTIVGYADYLPGQPTRGFVYQNGHFTDVGPLGTNAWAFGINDVGTIVGEYIDANRTEHGFIYDGTTYQTVDFPGAEQTAALGINNNGLVVLQYVLGDGNHAGLYDGNTYTTIDVPGATESFPSAINDQGDVVYTWYNAEGISVGAILHNGHFQNFMVPNSNQTVAVGINDQDVVVGFYYDHTLNFTPGFKLIP